MQVTSTCMKDSVTSSASFSLWIKKVEDLARFDLAWPGPLGTFSSFSIHLLSLVSTDFRCFDGSVEPCEEEDSGWPGGA